MQYSSAKRLNDVIEKLGHLSRDIYTVTHEEIAAELDDLRTELGSVIEED